jgi:hypothetical protein
MTNAEVFGYIRELLTDAVELGSKRTLISVGMDRPTISQSRAYDLYGRARVNRWVKDKLVKKHKQGKNTSGVTFDAMELEILDKTTIRYRKFVSDSPELSDSLHQ